VASDLTGLFWTKRYEKMAWKGALVMPKKRFNAEQIVTLLRQIEVLMAQGKSAPEGCRDAGISQQSFYRWRKEYGGLEIDQAKRMKDLERENVRLKRLVADLSLEKQVLKDVASGNL
jgi:putative transposase